MQHNCTLSCLLTEAEKESLRTATLDIGLRALSFDYIGTCPDDATEDAGTIQVHIRFFPSVLVFVPCYLELTPTRTIAFR